MAHAQNELIKDPRFIGSILSRIEDAVKDLDCTDALKPFLGEFEKTHAGTFAAQTDPAGNPLKPLAPSTIKRKGHSRILFETGRLEKSLTGKTGDSIQEVSHRGLLFGTEVPYSIFHQDPQAGSHLPKREHVGMTEEMADKITNAIAEAAIEAMKEA